jgi:hypothetical protein
MEQNLHFQTLKEESEKLYEENIKKLRVKNKILLNYILCNFDVDSFKFSKIDFETCFKIRNNLILSLSNFLE